jgi:hypothetical protein
VLSIRILMWTDIIEKIENRLVGWKRLIYRRVGG